LDDAVRLREAGAVIRDNAQIAQSPREQTWLEDQLSSAPRALGSARYASARRAGRAMTLGQSFELALRRDAATDPGSTLTRRELEIVSLLAAARTNRQIADQLVIAIPTVERHVANILEKLQLRSRSEVAVWSLARNQPTATG